MEQKILVTGSSGFVGQNLLSSLKNSGMDKIILLGRTIKILEGYKSSIYADFFKDIHQSAQHYIHLAGKAHDLKKTTNEQEYIEINYTLTKRLYDRFLEDREAKTFIFISSVKAAKDEVKGVLTEETECDPVTPYGKSKRKAEEYILANLPFNKKVYILRPCMIHGPGNKGNLNLLYGFAKKGLPFPLAAFDNQRSFLSVDNLIHVIKNLLEMPIVPPGIYNVADDETFSTNELIALMAHSLGKKPKLWEIPVTLIRRIALIGDYIKLPLNSERLQKLTESYKVSNEKIKKAIGKEMPLTGREGLVKTFESFK